MNPKVPVLVVSGFLGSGKTTLVRRLLADAQAHGIRLGIVSNEFGALGIDEALLGGTTERFVELAGGCVCCQLSDELVESLLVMRERVDPDRIVIETSGVALPFETQLNLYRPQVRDWVGDEACVVVVDAANLGDGGETLENQVSGADLILLNKVDLVGDPLPAEQLVHALNPTAPILRTQHCDAPVDLLYPTGPRPFARAERPAHVHEGFTSAELSVPDRLPPDEALRWISDRRGLRTKGFVNTSDGLRIVQGVGARIELSEPGGLQIDPALVNRVVTIRRG